MRRGAEAVALRCPCCARAPQGDESSHFGDRIESIPLEVLHRPLVLLRRRARGESAEIAPTAGLRETLLAQVEPVFAGSKLADHGVIVAQRDRLNKRRRDWSVPAPVPGRLVAMRRQNGSGRAFGSAAPFDGVLQPLPVGPAALALRAEMVAGRARPAVEHRMALAARAAPEARPHPSATLLTRLSVLPTGAGAMPALAAVARPNASAAPNKSVLVIFAPCALNIGNNSRTRRGNQPPRIIPNAKSHRAVARDHGMADTR